MLEWCLKMMHNMSFCVMFCMLAAPVIHTAQHHFSTKNKMIFTYIREPPMTDATIISTRDDCEKDILLENKCVDHEKIDRHLMNSIKWPSENHSYFVGARLTARTRTSQRKKDSHVIQLKIKWILELYSDVNITAIHMQTVSGDRPAKCIRWPMSNLRH